MTRTGRLRVHTMSMSLDGFVAGPDQSLDEPLGVGAMELLHGWMFGTRRFRDLDEAQGVAPADELDEEAVDAGFEGIGAWILGRNMFGPVRGDWGDGSWQGWWGEDPPYHCDVFVLTHHPRPPTRSTRRRSTRASRASARGSWDATCSGRSAATGATARGRAGGARTRRTTATCSS